VTHADEVNALVGHFYRSTLDISLPEYRTAMLREVQKLISFDAGLWATSSEYSGRFHSLSLLGLDDGFGQRLQHDRNARPILTAIHRQTSTVRPQAEILPDADFYASPIFERLCQPFGIRQLVGSARRQPESGLHAMVGLFRFDQRQPFTQDDRRIISHLIFHLMNAGAMATSIYLQKNSRNDGRHGSVVCDSLGFHYGFDRDFGRLMREHFPAWDGGPLPFDLPERRDQTSFAREGLRFRQEPLGDLIHLSAWRNGPLDTLTAREREIVVSVCRGLSYKEVARPLGIAPSTVSNHLYRVFEKLGITSRTELAKLVSETVRLH